MQRKTALICRGVTANYLEDIIQKQREPEFSSIHIVMRVGLKDYRRKKQKRRNEYSKQRV